MAMIEEKVWIEVHAKQWRAFCQLAHEQELTSARALGLLVEAHVLSELRKVLAARQRAFRAKQRASRDR